MIAWEQVIPIHCNLMGGGCNLQDLLSITEDPSYKSWVEAKENKPNF